MMLNYNVMPKTRSLKKDSNVSVYIFKYTEELLRELENIGIIEKMKNTPQLGVIKVAKKLEKTRYDYVMLQLYFHQLIQANLSQNLKFAYGNAVSSNLFNEENCCNDEEINLSIGETIQILILVYNIGHFYNTFVSSRAAIMLAKDNKDFLNLLLESSDEKEYKDSVNKIVNEENYFHFHLINSLLILNHCDQNKKSIKLAKKIVNSYINLNENYNDKLLYIYKLFKSVRNVSYLSYDLQISGIPLTIDLCNKSQMIVFFRELLSEYNDKSSMRNLVFCINKLLDDTVYNESTDAICYFAISKKIYSKVVQEKKLNKFNYYDNYFIDEQSVFNKHYSHEKKFDKNGMLKITFQNKNVALNLIKELDRTECVSAGYYDRNTEERTIVASIKNNCQKKDKVAFKVLKIVIKNLRELDEIDSTDDRYLLAVKFFLYYYFKCRFVEFKATVDKKICVCCTRGKRKKVEIIDEILSNEYGDEDQKHEVQYLRECILKDTKNDVCITLPCSIVVYEKETLRNVCEFDGMVIYPNRKVNQLMFLESKNKKVRGHAKRCLLKKFKDLNIKYDSKNIIIDNQDVNIKFSI